MKYPSTRLVFDRKNTASNETPALVQLEILYNGKRKYISTGVKVYRDQWSVKRHVINRTDLVDLNERIDSLKNKVDDYINEIIRNKTDFDWQALDRHLNRTLDKPITFVEYVSRRIDERNDIKQSTKKSHRKIVGSLRDFGRIVTFNDLTKSNIADYYQWMLGKEVVRIDRNGHRDNRRMSQQTVSGYMKILRTYIHDAILHEKIDRDPSVGIKVRRGESEDGRWLTEEELDQMYNSEMPTYSLRKARDLFVFMAETGLAFSDAMEFDSSLIVKADNGLCTYDGKRVKTNNRFFFVMTQRALDILDFYNGVLPRFTNQQFNMRLKAVADAACIDKPITSHYARRTCGYRLLNNGMSLEIVARVLGHKSIRTTETTYAKILNDTVIEAYKKYIK